MQQTWLICLFAYWHNWIQCAAACLVNCICITDFGLRFDNNRCQRYAVWVHAFDDATDLFVAHDALFSFLVRFFQTFQPTATNEWYELYEWQRTSDIYSLIFMCKPIRQAAILEHTPKTQKKRETRSSTWDWKRKIGPILDRHIFFSLENQMNSWRSRAFEISLAKVKWKSQNVPSLKWISLHRKCCISQDHFKSNRKKKNAIFFYRKWKWP